MSIAGTYDCVTNSPMGEQKSVFTIEPNADGKTFSGKNVGPMGEVELKDAEFEGNTISCKMDITTPMPMTLSCTAVIEDGKLDGTVNAGAFGDMRFTGTRRS